MDATNTPPARLITTAKQWLAFYVTCLGVLIVVLDTTIVNVALPTIRIDMALTDAAEVWVMDAYMLTFGGFLILSGRLADRYGERRLFLLGIAAFSTASLACGLATSQDALIGARLAQGLGGAIVQAVALSLITKLFPENAVRARAMGIYAAISAAGGALGILLGGALTSAFNWHWVFLVNIPFGILVFGLSAAFVPHMTRAGRITEIDFAGAITMTLGFLIGIYGLVSVGQVGWTSAQSLSSFAIAVVLFLTFIRIELRATAPLVPPSVFKTPKVIAANIAASFWAVALFSWIFIGTQYLQFARGLTPVQVGLAFVPSNLLMGVSSVCLSDKLVFRYGIKRPLMTGFLIAASGLILLVRLNTGLHAMTDVLPGMILIGLGAGIAFNPLLLAATSGASWRDSGLISGIVNTSLLIGGAFGIAILANLTTFWKSHLIALGANPAAAIRGGYQASFLLGAVAATLAAVVAATIERPVRTTGVK